MQKNEMRNFVCSFVLSLLAAVTVSKALLRMYSPTPEKNAENIKIQNISLFREPVLATQKTPTAPEVDLSALETLTAPEKAKETPKLAETAQYDIRRLRAEKPLLEVTPKTKQTPAVQPIYQPEDEINTDLASAEEIRFDEPDTPAKFDSEAETVTLADISDTLKDEKIQEATPRQPIYQPEEDVENEQAESKTILASLDFQNSEDSLSDVSEVSLIPLEENTEIQHQEIKPLHQADGSQIAMLEPNNLINTIDTFDVTEEKTLDEADLKQSELSQTVDTTENSAWITAQANTEESAQPAQASAIQASEEDSPWVIARGNKYAKNKNIVEQFAEDKIVVETPVVSQPSVATDTPVIISETTDIDNTESTTLPDASENLDTETEPEIPTENTVSEVLQPKPLLRPIGEDTKLAYQMIDNLLIPIPEDIKNDTNLTPTLSVTPSDKPKEKLEKFQPTTPVIGETGGSVQKEDVPSKKAEKAEKEKKKDTAKKEPKDDKKEVKESDKDSGLFKSIAGWFSSKPNAEKMQKEPEKVEKKPEQTKKKTLKSGLSFFKISKENEKPETEAPIIMPAELRLSFQPNRAEISGQTLRWIHAFADNARDNDGVYVEVRIDGTSSFALQKKRLNLLSTILANRGVDYRKVNIVFTSREPNSFIIRNIRLNNHDEAVARGDKTGTYHQTW